MPNRGNRNFPWQREEVKYLKKRVEKDHIHPHDVYYEMKEKFGGGKPYRTFNAVRHKLNDLDVSYGGLRRKDEISQINESVESSGVKMAPAKEPTERELREQLSSMGYRVEKVEQASVDRRFKVDTSMFEGDTYKMAVISCTQLGSRYQQLTHLKSFYQYIQDQGIKTVLNCGDIVDGIRVYRGQEYELFIHGAKAQREYTIEHYPKMENGGKTIMISGNHDYSFMANGGEKIVETICDKREDLEYVGDYGAYPKIGPLNIFMAHGDCGVSYARSYKLQKNIEQMSPANKPDIYFVGHWHVGCMLPEYRNVIAFMIPCFQSQTPFLKRKSLYPELGGLIVSFTINDVTRKDGIARCKFEWVPFYVPIDNDY